MQVIRIRTRFNMATSSNIYVRVYTRDVGACVSVRTITGIVLVWERSVSLTYLRVVTIS